MEEKFLHYIWKNKLFKQFELFTTTGEKLEIIQPGEYNRFASGPDFFNALIKLNGSLWAGNLELHVYSSEWNQHGHQNDPAYENVILHVVYENDQEIKNSSNKIIPTLELIGLIPDEYLIRYEHLKKSPTTIACGKNVGCVEGIILSQWISTLAKERTDEKTNAIREILKETGNDWMETFYRALARNFGFKTNALPFYLLARHLPLKILRRHTHDTIQLEALLLGQAGFLEGYFEEKYALKLQNEYEFLKTKYSLMPLKKSIWKTGGMRPHNFPELRIAQFASLIEKIPTLFSLATKSIDALPIIQQFDTEVSVFWKTHFNLETSSPVSSGKPGKNAIANIMINTIAPIRWLYKKQSDRVDDVATAFELLTQLPPEQNAIIKIYSDLGLKCENALQTQALLQLNSNYCTKRKCLECEIGKSILCIKSDLDTVHARLSM